MMNDAHGFSVSDHAEPVITITKGLLHEAADAGIAALMRAGRDIYQRSGQLVRPAMIPARASDGARLLTPGIVPVTEPFLRRELGMVARWERFTSEGDPVRYDPPPAVVAQIMSMSGHWPFHALIATISTPTLRPDGTLLAKEGYDAATGLMLLGAPTMPPIAERPTKSDALAALATLKGLLREFPFTSDASRSVGLSMLITPVVRAACGNAVPLHTITAPEAGTGKSYLADLAALISIGSRCPAMTYVTKDNELEKRLGGLLISGASIVSIDNANWCVLDSDFLCQAIERPLVAVRVLGTSEVLRIPNAVLITANGNNMRVGYDLTRRAIRSEMDANKEDPLSRTFKFDPAAMIMHDRGTFVAACLTFVRAYIAAGRPERLPPMPSFEGWSDTVRSALAWVGEEDPVSTNSAARDEDPGRQQLAAMLAFWPTDQTKYSTAELLKRGTETLSDGDLAWPEFATALQAVATDKRGRLSAEVLGKWLRDNKGRQAGGRKLVRDGTPTRPAWKSEACGDQQDCGDATDSSRAKGGGKNNSTWHSHPHEAPEPHTDGAYRDPGVTI
jgi:hypothetical protein